MVQEYFDADTDENEPAYELESVLEKMSDRFADIYPRHADDERDGPDE